MLLHFMNSDLSALTASCTSHSILLLNLKLMRISLVPLFSLFLTRTILNFQGCYFDNFQSYVQMRRIYFYLEEHLHRMMSPTLKLRRLGADYQSGLFHNSKDQYTFLDTFIRLWMSLLRQNMTQLWMFLTILFENLPAIFSSQSIYSPPEVLHYFSSIFDCISQLFSDISFINLLISSFSACSNLSVYLRSQGRYTLILLPFSILMLSDLLVKQLLSSNFCHSYSHHLVRMRRIVGLFIVIFLLYISLSVYFQVFQGIFLPIRKWVYYFTDYLQ